MKAREKCSWSLTRVEKLCSLGICSELGTKYYLVKSTLSLKSGPRMVVLIYRDEFGTKATVEKEYGVLKMIEGDDGVVLGRSSHFTRNNLIVPFGSRQ